MRRRSCKKKTREGHSKQEKKQSTGDKNELSMLLEQNPAEWGWSNVGRRGWREKRCKRSLSLQIKSLRRLEAGIRKLGSSAQTVMNKM